MSTIGGLFALLFVVLVNYVSPLGITIIFSFIGLVMIYFIQKLKSYLKVISQMNMQILKLVEALVNKIQKKPSFSRDRFYQYHLKKSKQKRPKGSF